MSGMYSFKTDLDGAKRRFALRSGICTYDKVRSTIGCKYAKDRGTISLTVADTDVPITDDASLLRALQQSHDATTGKGCLKLTVRNTPAQQGPSAAAPQGFSAAPTSLNASSDSTTSSSSSSSDSSGGGSDDDDDDEGEKDEEKGSGQHDTSQEGPRLPVDAADDDEEEDDQEDEEDEEDDQEHDDDDDDDAHDDGMDHGPAWSSPIPNGGGMLDTDGLLTMELQQLHTEMQLMEFRELEQRRAMQHAKRHLAHIRALKRTLRRHMQEVRAQMKQQGDSSGNSESRRYIREQLAAAVDQHGVTTELQQRTAPPPPSPAFPYGAPPLYPPVDPPTAMVTAPQPTATNPTGNGTAATNIESSTSTSTSTHHRRRSCPRHGPSAARGGSGGRGGHAGRSGSPANWQALLPEGAVVTLTTTTLTPPTKKTTKKITKKTTEKRDQVPLNVAAVDSGRAGLVPAASAAQRTLEFVVEHAPRCKLKLRNRNTGGYLRICRDGTIDCRGRGGRFSCLAPILDSPPPGQRSSTTATRGVRMYIGRVGRAGASHYMCAGDTADSELSSVEDARHAHALQVTVVGHVDPTGDEGDAAAHHRLHRRQHHRHHHHQHMHAHHPHLHHRHNLHAGAHCPRFNDPHHLHPHSPHHHHQQQHHQHQHHQQQHHHHHQQQHPFAPPTHMMPHHFGMFTPPPYPPPYGAVGPTDKPSQQHQHPAAGHGAAFPPPPPPQYQPPLPASAYPRQYQHAHYQQQQHVQQHQQQHQAAVAASTEGIFGERARLDQRRQLKEERRRLKEERRRLKQMRKQEKKERRKEEKKDQRRSHGDKRE